MRPTILRKERLRRVRCAEPDLDAAMEPYDALVARVREAEARLAATHLAVHPECATTCEHGATA